MINLKIKQCWHSIYCKKYLHKLNNNAQKASDVNNLSKNIEVNAVREVQK
jgi:hypothetical protein